MTDNTIRAIAESIRMMTRAFRAMGGQGPLKVFVDDASADVILSCVGRAAPFADFLTEKQGREPTYLATILGAEFHNEHPRSFVSSVTLSVPLKDR